LVYRIPEELGCKQNRTNDVNRLKIATHCDQVAESIQW